MRSSCSDRVRIHVRIDPALALTLQLFSANFSLILECTFAWQAQYLVRLEGDACCSAHRNDPPYVTMINHACHVPW